MAHVDDMARVAERYNCRLTLLAEEPDMYGDCGTACVIEFPTRDAAALRRYIGEHRSDIVNVFSVTDTWGVIASELRDEFGFPQFMDTARLRQLRDKGFVQQTLQKAGLASDAADRWPCIVKPRNGTGKIGVTWVPDETAMRQLEHRGIDLADTIIQPYHRGPLYSAEVWDDGTRFLLMGVTNRIMTRPPVFLELVKSFPWAAGTPWERSVEEWVRRILDAVGYDLGLAHVEFVETAHGFELVEINCRMAGSLITPGIVATTNCNPYRMAVEQALGMPVSLPVRRTVTGGFSHVSIYADRTGTVTSIQGMETCAAYPGCPQWYPTHDVGSVITQTGTYRARIGNVSASGPDASVAQDRALAASQSIEVHIDRE